MRVLVAFGSKRGGSAGVADMIGDALREADCEAAVCPATGVYDRPCPSRRIQLSP